MIKLRILNYLGRFSIITRVLIGESVWGVGRETERMNGNDDAKRLAVRMEKGP